ncbi:S9 family peptidase [Flavobacterium sp. MAHUQ-51]|uniref:S9 family peptidase n=1 Tax=Flavobacterium sp. GCM10022190 TaxID=3252639 RepID=UPI0036141803
MKKIKLYTCLLSGILLQLTNAYAQEKKLKLTAEEFQKWSIIQKEEISPDGQWISYMLDYESENDTLFIQNTENLKRLCFPKATKMVFSPDSKWSVVMGKQGFYLVDLKKNKLQKIDNVITTDFSADSRYLYLLLKEKKLQILDLNKTESKDFSGINSFFLGSNNTLAILDSSGVSIISPKDNYSRKQIFQKENATITNLLWNNTATALAFTEELPANNVTDVKYNLYYYDIMESRLSIFNPNNKPELNNLNVINPGVLTRMRFAADDQKLFFYMAPPNVKESDANQPEIWDTALPLEFTSQRYKGDTKKLPKLLSWNPKSDKIQLIGTNERPDVKLSMSRKLAITYNNLQYEPIFTTEKPVDLYLIDLESGKEQLFLKKQELTTSQLASSADERYISYFRDKNWWIFDRITNTHKNLTAVLGVPFYDVDFDRPSTAPPFDNAYWTDNNKLLLTDQYDIWMLSPDGSAERITSGREHKISYSIPFSEIPSFKPFSLSNFGRPSLVLSKGLILQSRGNNEESGYSLYMPNKKLKTLFYSNSGCSTLNRATMAGSYIFKEQTVSISPKIKFANSNSKAPKMLFQSNPQYVKYEMPQAELISFTNKIKTDLKGILYYPVGYNPNKKYPMIVYIYEKLSVGYHKFLRNNNFDAIGFNPINYNLDGYLVLFPDIEYQIGNAGKSALDCVESAIEVVAKKGIVDLNRLGIVGHSYGGYEVNNIVTQTPRFKAAVSGAGISDLTSFYFYYHLETDKSNMWRIEDQQFRMGKSFFHNKQGYLNNSPIMHSDKITSPLLIWSGKEDINVPKEQSMELYMSLRRQNKKALLLLYPDEPHSLVKYENQLDLKKRTKQWFDYYLKGI